MSFLPIVERELRVAARRKSTWYARGAAALLGMIIGFFMLLMLSLAQSFSAGPYVFTFLSWYVLLTSMLAGIFLASDCLSEERREGTLGLLFLTALKGHDVVLGKFMAVSLNAFYALLAVFPVLALCLLAGGVHVAEFWRTALALVNLLFFSVTAAMLVSSFCRSSFRALVGAIALVAGWLALAGIASSAQLYSAAECSPLEAFLTAPAVNYQRLARVYWSSLAVSHLIGWGFLGFAGWRMRAFVDKGKTTGAWQRVFTRNLPARTAARRARLLEINPVLWLLNDSRRLRWVSWLLSLLAVALLIIMGVKGGPMAFQASGYAMWPFYFLLKVLAAIQACRFFGEARRTGAFELLCCTPLTMSAIVQGQWMLLRSVFLWPLVALLSAHLMALIIMSTGANGMAFSTLMFPGQFRFLAYIWHFKDIVNNLADFFAIGWFGMWLSLSMQRPNLAAGLTILLTLILPMIAVCIPTLATDAIFITVGWVKLSEDFRMRQAQWVRLKPA